MKKEGPSFPPDVYHLFTCKNTEALFGYMLVMYTDPVDEGSYIDTVCMEQTKKFVHNSPRKVWIYGISSPGRDLVDRLVETARNEGSSNQSKKRTCAAIPLLLPGQGGEAAHSAVVFVSFVDRELFLYDPHGVHDRHPVSDDIEQAVRTINEGSGPTWSASTCRGNSFQSYFPLPLCNLFVAYAMCVVSFYLPDRASVREAWSTLLVENQHGLVDHMEQFYRFMNVLMHKTRRSSMQSGDSVLVFGSGSTGCPASIIECDKKRQTASIHVSRRFASPSMLAMASDLGCSVVSPWGDGVRINNMPVAFMVEGTCEFK